MRLFKVPCQYLNEDYIAITKKSVEIKNYQELKALSSEKIVLKKYIINGKDLTIKIITNDEILVIGTIKGVEFIED